MGAVDEAEMTVLPEIDASNRPYWEGCAVGELRLQLCSECGLHRFPPSPICQRCLSDRYEWKPASGRGRLWSWIVMHQNYLPAFADRLPYLVAFVELDEGPLMVSTLVNPTADLHCGVALEVVFEPIVGSRPLPKFRLIS